MRILCFEIRYVGFRRASWKIEAKAGNKIEAIKLLRTSRNAKFENVNDPRRMGLREAKEIVDNYMYRHLKE